MDSIGPLCTKLKQKYEACFYTWYTEKFLKGQATKNECVDLFEVYRACLDEALKEQGVDKFLDKNAQGKASSSDTITSINADIIEGVKKHQ